jgi:SAM-dependent methyltransferase
MQRNFAAQYSDLEKWHWWFRGRRKILESVLRPRLGACESRNILSVGCGPSDGLKWLLPFSGKAGKVVGLDVDSTHGRDAPAQIEFVFGALQDAPLADASFDLVLALDVLEHLDDDVAGLKKIVSLIKPGGLLLLTVPALPSLWGGQDVVSEHRRRYTKRSLRRLFDGLNLQDYQVKYFNTILFPLAAPIRWSRRAFGLDDRPRSDFDSNQPGLVNDILAWAFGVESSFINHASMPIGLSLLVTYRTRTR